MPTRDLGEIKAAYRAHAQKFHPDKALTCEEKKRYTLRFIELREVYMDAKFRAQYEPDLQPLCIRYPPDPSENVLLSNDWFVAAIAIAAGLFGFWLLSVSTAHYPVHTLSMTHAIVIVASTRLPAFGDGRVGASGMLKELLRRPAAALCGACFRLRFKPD